MRWPALGHSPSLAVLSVVLAIALSMAALFLDHRFHCDGGPTGWQKALCAICLGGAMPVAHYTGMAAVSPVPLTAAGGPAHALRISELGLAGLLLFTLLLLAVTIVTSLIDRRLSAQALMLAESERRQRELVSQLAGHNQRLEKTNRRLELASAEADTYQRMIEVAQAAGGLSLWDWDLTTGLANCGEQWFEIHRIGDRRIP